MKLRDLCALAVLALLAWSATHATFVQCSPPDRPDATPKKAPKELPVPGIAGPCNWGEITQDGRKITIDGHLHWYVHTGEIRKDGSLYVVWIWREDGRAAPGVYAIRQDKSIQGKWGWGTDVAEDKDGNLSGLKYDDTLRPAPRID